LRDRLGILLFAQASGQLLLHLVSKLKFYEHTSIIFVTNPTFSESPSVFGDEKMTNALLDRLPRRCEIVETRRESWRFKTASDAQAIKTSKAPSGDAAAPRIRYAHRSTAAPSTNLYSGSILDADTGSMLNAY
jgi:IstB-like ATP binding protein